MNQTQRQKRNLQKRTARKKLLKNSGGNGKEFMALRDAESRYELKQDEKKNDYLKLAEKLK